ncbi:hypothetical protein [Nannocystis pusilla]|uniref:hypothetical protein n=1 Tax=Nannocystis pusilla TaxID=889268 RepID=UPI003DA4C924
MTTSPTTSTLPSTSTTSTSTTDAASTGRDPRTSHGLVGAAAGLTMAILHCVFVGSLA